MYKHQEEVNKEFDQHWEQIMYKDRFSKVVGSQVKAFIANVRSIDLESIKEWAKSTAGATGVDMRGRKWIDLEDLLTFLNNNKR